MTPEELNRVIEEKADRYVFYVTGFRAGIEATISYFEDFTNQPDLPEDLDPIVFAIRLLCEGAKDGLSDSINNPQ